MRNMKLLRPIAFMCLLYNDAMICQLAQYCSETTVIAGAHFPYTLILPVAVGYGRKCILLRPWFLTAVSIKLELQPSQVLKTFGVTASETLHYAHHTDEIVGRGPTLGTIPSLS